MPKLVFLGDVLQSHAHTASLMLRCFIRLIFACVSLTSSVFICRPCECGAKGGGGGGEGVKGQGPGEEVTSQETARLKLGLRLAFHGQSG